MITILSSTGSHSIHDFLCMHSLDTYTFMFIHTHIFGNTCVQSNVNANPLNASVDIGTILHKWAVGQRSALLAGENNTNLK